MATISRINFSLVAKKNCDRWPRARDLRFGEKEREQEREICQIGGLINSRKEKKGKKDILVFSPQARRCHTCRIFFFKDRKVYFAMLLTL